jgi:SOS-response transcriptional repressor LexA
MHDEVTVKRLRIERHRPMLVPENERFKPIEFDEDTLIDGVVVGLVRDLTARRRTGGSLWAR